MKNRIKELEEIIEKNNELYYNDSIIKISDEEYDNLKDELQTLNPDSKTLKNVGTECYATSPWEKVKHSTIIGSLNKVNNVSDLIAWQTKRNIKDLIAMLKFDGLTLVCDYVDGELVRAVTRGDGETGEDVVKNAKLIKGIVCADKTFTGTLRGEVVVHKDVFEKVFKKDYANPRNIASGSLKRKSGKNCEFLDVYFYEVLKALSFNDASIKAIKKLGKKDKRTDWLYWINKNFDNHTWYVVAEKAVDIESVVKKMTAKRDSLNVQIDGLVFRSNSRWENKKKPDYAMAYKFEAVQARTEIIDIEWKNTGKAISPTANLKTVWIDGSNVSRASVHNVDWMIKNKIGKNAIVLVEKKGDIIPAIEEVIEVGEDVFIPSKCPVCSAPTEMKKQFLVCSSNTCPAKQLRHIKHLFKVFDINFAGEKTIEAIAKKYSIEEMIRIINNDLQSFEEWLATLPRMGEKSAHKIYTELFNKRKISVMQAIWILDINNFSSSRIEKIIEAGFDTIEKIRYITKQEIRAVAGFKDVLANEIIEGINGSLDLLEQIVSCFDILDYEKPKTLTTRDDMSDTTVFNFVFTGALSKTRKEYSEIVGGCGHLIGKTLNSNTDYLVYGEGPIGSKHKKADKLGVAKITEDELLEILGGEYE